MRINGCNSYSDKKEININNSRKKNFKKIYSKVNQKYFKIT